jgi:hypothetical protein
MALIIVIATAMLVAQQATDPPGVTHGRTIRSVDATMVLLIVAIPFYFLQFRDRRYSEWWLAFWTASLVAFVIHLAFAIFGTFGGDFRAVFHHGELVSHPVFDLFLFIWWVIDGWLAWMAATYFLVRVQRTVLHGILTLAFFMATREDGVSRTGQWLGVILLLAAVAAVLSATVRRPRRV